jgi:hypothetical protein
MESRSLTGEEVGRDSKAEHTMDKTDNLGCWRLGKNIAD